MPPPAAGSVGVDVILSAEATSAKSWRGPSTLTLLHKLSDTKLIWVVVEVAAAETSQFAVVVAKPAWE